MSNRKIATALGAAVLLLGAPASYALATERPDRPGKPDKQKECSDGVDNDGQPGVDYADDGSGDPDCGSPNDNSEAAEPGEDPGGGTPGLPALPPELPGLPPELPTLPELPGGGAPALPALPAPDPAAVEALVQDVLDQLPPTAA